MIHHVVFFTSLERDLPYIAVSVRSLVDHFPKPSSLHIHVLWYGLEVSKLEFLWKSLDDLKCHIHSHNIEPWVGDRTGKPGFGYWAYLWLVKALPPEAQRALYLDCDTMVYDDVSPLLAVELGDSVLAAAVDPGSRVLRNQATLDRWARENQVEYRPKETPYINGGMLYFNLKAWRDEGLLESLDERFRNDYDSLRYHDQDAINLFLGTRVKLVSVRWNLLEILDFWDDWDFEIQRPVDQPQNYFVPGIKHFAGPHKPDTEFVRITDREHYYRYFGQTAWGGQDSSSVSSLRGRLIAELLEFRYLVLRGLQQKALPEPWLPILKLLKRAPYIPLFYPLFYLHRLRLKMAT
jgi:lipopolysaccharide biosynthesis glycosyltransferase